MPEGKDLQNHYTFAAWVLRTGEDWRELVRLAEVGRKTEGD